MVNEVVTTGQVQGRPIGAFLDPGAEGIVSRSVTMYSEELGRGCCPRPRIENASLPCKDKKEEAKKNPVVQSQLKTSC